jgi:hypothetical protein
MATTPTRNKQNGRKPTKKRPRRISNAKLLKLAKKHRPPQSWFDDTDVPFTPAKD